jgi:hypothetical protein
MTQIDAAGGAAPHVTRFSYPTSAMAGDYLRAAAGLVPTGAILATVSVGDVAAVVLGGFATIFGAFAVRTALRHGTSLEVDDVELRATGLRQATIPWARLSLDSRLDGFDRLVRYAATAAAERGLELSEATAANLQALGVRVPPR